MVGIERWKREGQCSSFKLKGEVASLIQAILRLNPIFDESVELES